MDSGTGPADPATAGPMFALALWCQKKLADAISEVLNSKNFPSFMCTISYLADECLESLD